MERSFNAPPHPQDSVGVYMNCQVRARLELRSNCFGVSDGVSDRRAQRGSRTDFTTSQGPFWAATSPPRAFIRSAAMRAASVSGSSRMISR
jgi:hypothetical protein